MISVSISSNVLDGLKIATLDDYENYSTVIESSRPIGFSYYYPALLAYERPGRRAIFLYEDNDSLCTFLWQMKDGIPRLDLYLAPIPLVTTVLHRCIERANEFNGDRSARILRIDEADADAVAAAGYRLHERKQQFLFAPANYMDLGGKSLYTVRRNVSRVEKLPDVQVDTYTPDYKMGCKALLRRWRKEHRERHGKGGGIGYTKSILELAGRLPERALSGQVVLIDGQVAAFAFGGVMHSRLACSYERKCDTAVTGLTFFQMYQLLLHFNDYELVNDGSDNNRAGLRQLKTSFRPVAMHQEYRGYQK
jgi:hypothetical protein